MDKLDIPENINKTYYYIHLYNLKKPIIIFMISLHIYSIFNYTKIKNQNHFTIFIISYRNPLTISLSFI